MTDSHADSHAGLVAHVNESPGTHFNELVRRLGVAPDTLHRLQAEAEAADAIVVDEHYGKTHFYPADISPENRRVLALLRRETSREILVCLLNEAPTTPTTVAERVDIARSTLEWHLDRLIDAELVAKRRDGRRVLLVVPGADRVEDLLADIEPRMADRVLDRTTRLFDHLFEE